MSKFLELLCVILLLLLRNSRSSSLLSPQGDVYVCSREAREVSFICNTSSYSVTWDINVNGVSHNVNFVSFSPLHSNKYKNGYDGINVTLESATAYHLLSNTVIRIPPFNISKDRLVVYCNGMSGALLETSKKNLISYILKILK